MAIYKFSVNDLAVNVDSWDPEQPLLYVLRTALYFRGYASPYQFLIRFFPMTLANAFE
jgi:hypothetical protein